MDLRYLRRFFRSFRLVLQKWVRAAAGTGEKIRENLPVFRRVVILLLAGVVFLPLLIWGFARLITVDEPAVPLLLEGEDPTTMIFSRTGAAST